MSLFEELKRRKVFRVAAAYAVAAWLIIQIAATVFPSFGIPDWAFRLVTLLALLGFPIALILAWVLDITPHGIKVTAGSGNKGFYVVIGVPTIAAIGWYWYGAHRAASTAPSNARSIAVLPFVNMSGDPENEFFSDGLSEEILNSLARIDGMLVVGRTSSFQFKGKNEDLRGIGEKLGVATVLEGSVRREGERARITAQLIRASDGIHLWSETYDRTVNDTLAVQLDIAEQVAGALNVVLDDRQRERMRAAGIKNVDAFIAYQKGLKLYEDAHAKPDLDLFDTLALANEQFARATQLEPDFSLAFFATADRSEHLLLSDGRSAPERADAQRDALKVLESAAATSRDAQQRLLALAERQMLSDDWRGLPSQIDAAFKQPGCNPSNWLPVFASAFGYGDEIEALGARASTCNPLDFINYNTRIRVALATGHAQRALSVLAAAEKARGGVTRARTSRALALAMLGQPGDAGDSLESSPPAVPGENDYIARVIIGRVHGEDPATVHARLQAIDRTRSKYRQWDMTDLVEAAIAGDHADANRRAAAIDARPAGAFVLAVVAADCLCGAPFDLDATPNFRARLAESGLRWPPPVTIKYPPLAQAPRP